MSDVEPIIEAAEKLIESLTFDDSGSAGRGGNGGLISRDTIRKSDQLRVLLLRWRKQNPHQPPDLAL